MAKHLRDYVTSPLLQDNVPEDKRDRALFARFVGDGKFSKVLIAEDVKEPEDFVHIVFDENPKGHLFTHVSNVIFSVPE
jgi:hypothetical protein